MIPRPTRHLFARIFLPLALPLLAGIALYGDSEMERELTEWRARETLNVGLGAGALSRKLEETGRDLLFLAGHSALRAALNDPSPAHLDHLAEEFAHFSRVKGVYDQIRWLDQGGREVVRIDLRDGRPLRVPETRLQEKGRRYYFTDTLRLSPGELFISPLDLNIEQGEVERPFKPMIRIGTPLVDERGARRGVVLLNYYGDELLEAFATASANIADHIALVNRDGFWLKGPDPEREWGFMLDRPGHSLAVDEPRAWARLRGEESGQITGLNGIWSWATVYPLLEGQHSSGGAATAHAPSSGGVERRAYFWKVVAHLPAERLDQLRAEVWLRLAGIALLLLAVAALGSWKLARAWTALATARREAEQANRAKSLFLANMSHELRTPLHAVLGFSELMRRDPAASDEQRRYLRVIRHGGEHLLALIDDVLDMSRIEANRVELEPVAFDLRETLETIGEMMALRAEERDIEFRLELEEGVGDGTARFVRCDAGKLRQVLINLVGNALKFTDTGAVTLRAGARAEGDRLRLRFEVADSGRGIAADDLGRIFVPFVQVGGGDGEARGSGLGLAISRRFVQRMGGDLEVTSRLGEGSLFRFELPAERADEAAARAEGRPRRVKRLAGGQPTYRVLVADDTDGSRLLLAELLRKVGFEVREARDGREAVALFTDWRPHLVWMDMRMPTMDGCEATRRIKASPGGEETAVLALTASTFGNERKRALAAGCREFVRKPFRESEIFEAMARQLGVRYLYEAPSNSDGETSP